MVAFLMRPQYLDPHDQFYPEYSQLYIGSLDVDVPVIFIYYFAFVLQGRIWETSCWKPGLKSWTGTVLKLFKWNEKQG